MKTGLFFCLTFLVESIMKSSGPGVFFEKNFFVKSIVICCLHSCLIGNLYIFVVFLSLEVYFFLYFICIYFVFYIYIILTMLTYCSILTMSNLILFLLWLIHYCLVSELMTNLVDLCTLSSVCLSKFHTVNPYI